jgi:hypothetical protein
MPMTPESYQIVALGVTVRLTMTHGHREYQDEVGPSSR